MMNHDGALLDRRSCPRNDKSFACFAQSWHHTHFCWFHFVWLDMAGNGDGVHMRTGLQALWMTRSIVFALLSFIPALDGLPRQVRVHMCGSLRILYGSRHFFSQGKTLVSSCLSTYTTPTFVNARRQFGFDASRKQLARHTHGVPSGCPVQPLLLDH